MHPLEVTCRGCVTSRRAQAEPGGSGIGLCVVFVAAVRVLMLDIQVLSDASRRSHRARRRTRPPSRRATQAQVPRRLTSRVSRSLSFAFKPNEACRL